MGIPSQSSQTYLLIHFVYNLAQKPYFDQSPMILSLYENDPVGTRVGIIRARDPDLGNAADISYKLLDSNNLFELKPSGTFNSIQLQTKFIANYETDSSKIFNITIRAYSGSLYTDCLVQVYLKQFKDLNTIVPKKFRIIFNNYKNFFLTEQSARVPILDNDMLGHLTFRYIFYLKNLLKI